jgi:hypothetical protein
LIRPRRDDVLYLPLLHRRPRHAVPTMPCHAERVLVYRRPYPPYTPRGVSRYDQTRHFFSLYKYNQCRAVAPIQGFPTRRGDEVRHWTICVRSSCVDSCRPFLLSAIEAFGSTTTRCSIGVRQWTVFDFSDQDTGARSYPEVCSRRSASRSLDRARGGGACCSPGSHRSSGGCPAGECPGGECPGGFHGGSCVEHRVSESSPGHSGRSIADIGHGRHVLLALGPVEQIEQDTWRRRSRGQSRAPQIDLTTTHGARSAWNSRRLASSPRWRGEGCHRVTQDNFMRLPTGPRARRRMAIPVPRG